MYLMLDVFEKVLMNMIKNMPLHQGLVNNLELQNNYSLSCMLGFYKHQRIHIYLVEWMLKLHDYYYHYNNQDTLTLKLVLKLALKLALKMLSKI